MSGWTSYEIIRCVIEGLGLLLLIVTGMVAWGVRVERMQAGLESRLGIMPDLLEEWKSMQCDLTEIRTHVGMHNSEGNLARKERLEKVLAKTTGEMPVAK